MFQIDLKCALWSCIAGLW